MAVAQNHRVKSGNIVGLGEFARIIGRTENYCRECIQDGMPVAQRGDRGTSWQIETGPAIWWLMQREASRARGADERVRHDPKVRREFAQAELAEMNVAVRRGELAPVDLLRQALGAAVTRARTRLLALPVKLAPVVVGMKAPEAKAAIEQAVHEALAELAGAAPALDEAVEAAAGGDA